MQPSITYFNIFEIPTKKLFEFTARIKSYKLNYTKLNKTSKRKIKCLFEMRKKQ